MTKALYKLFTKINTAVAVIFEIIQEIFFFYAKQLNDNHSIFWLINPILQGGSKKFVRDLFRKQFFTTNQFDLKSNLFKNNPSKVEVAKVMESFSILSFFEVTR